MSTLSTRHHHPLLSPRTLSGLGFPPLSLTIPNRTGLWAPRIKLELARARARVCVCKRAGARTRAEPARRGCPALTASRRQSLLSSSRQASSRSSRALCCLRTAWVSSFAGDTGLSGPGQWWAGGEHALRRACLGCPWATPRLMVCTYTNPQTASGLCGLCHNHKTPCLPAARRRHYRSEGPAAPPATCD